MGEMVAETPRNKSPLRFTVLKSWMEICVVENGMKIESFSLDYWLENERREERGILRFVGGERRRR